MCVALGGLDATRADPVNSACLTNARFPASKSMTPRGGWTEKNHRSRYNDIPLTTPGDFRKSLQLFYLRAMLFLYRQFGGGFGYSTLS